MPGRPTRSTGAGASKPLQRRIPFHAHCHRPPRRAGPDRGPGRQPGLGRHGAVRGLRPARLRPAAQEHPRRAARARAARGVRQPHAPGDAAGHHPGVPADVARGRAVPEAGRLARRDRQPQQARHPGRLRRHPVRHGIPAGQRAVRRGHPGRPAGGRLHGPALVVGRRQALRVRQHGARRRGAVDRRRHHRRAAQGAGRAPEPDARWRPAMDARPPRAAGQAGARQHGRAAGRAAGAARPQHPGDGFGQGREQHLRDPRHAEEPARRGPVRLVRALAGGPRRRRHAGGHARGHAGQHRGRRAGARWPAPAGGRAAQAVLLRHHARALPARGAGVEHRQAQRGDVHHHRVDPADRPRAGGRRAHRAA